MAWMYLCVHSILVPRSMFPVFREQCFKRRITEPMAAIVLRTCTASRLRVVKTIRLHMADAATRDLSPLRAQPRLTTHVVSLTRAPLAVLRSQYTLNWLDDRPGATAASIRREPAPFVAWLQNATARACTNMHVTATRAATELAPAVGTPLVRLAYEAMAADLEAALVDGVGARLGLWRYHAEPAARAFLRHFRHRRRADFHKPADQPREEKWAALEHTLGPRALHDAVAATPACQPLRALFDAHRPAV